MDDQASELEALERILIDKSAEPIRLSYAVVKHITNNFSQEVGRGGFGVVYLGVLPRGKVAVKKLIMSQDFSDEHFIEEVRCLFRAKHKNIVKFLGYCSATEGELIQVNGRYHLADIRHRLLCFEYAPNGNLHSYLKEKCYEDEWNIRYKILKGICQGLDCLHKERINHLDLKPENVLLDAHMEPKITDFGLSRCFDEKQSRIFTQTLRGTVGYIAPELIDKGEISFKSDIFSLGIIMIKLLTGHNEYDIDNWHESISIDCPQIKRCIEVARLCVDSDQYSRPSIAEIINKLDKETMIPMVPLAINELKNDPRLSLYKENIPSFKEIVQEWDECFVYPEFYNNCTQEPTNLGDKSYLDLRTKASQGAVVSSGILRADENDTEFIEVDDTILDTYHTIEDNKTLKFDVPYNILPLNATSNDNAIRRYPEIRETVYALQNIRGLQWTNTHDENNDKIHTGNDLFDWLQATFRFQKDNASNQREHLILLLANVQIRQTPLPDQELKLDDRALDVVMKKLFKNYKKWCKYLGRESNLRLPTTQREAQQHKILYMGLYLLIWGEAANLRFMPECLCYIYHHMAFELYGMLAGHVSPFTGGYVKPAYGGEDEAFLMNVVTPIHKVIEKEAERSMAVKSNDHSYWRNYDDLNEYFWSNDCSQLGWPMRADADFFRTPKDNMPTSTGKVHWMGKVNFVEIRSFLHVFLSFDRMWVFLILSLQAMIIIAWNDGTLGDIFEIEVFKKVLSIFITAALLNLGQAFLVIVFCWKARRSMSTAVKLRYVLKLISAITWVLILPATYAYTSDNPSSLENIIKYLFGDNHNLSLYIMAVLIYLIPNMLAALLLIFPFLRKFLESSEVKVIVVMMWWSEPCLFVGRNMHESAFSVLKYTVFWVTVLAMKFTVNFYVEIKPLVQPTKDILGKSIQTFQCQDFCPYANNKIGVLFAFWAPIVLVYFMDIQIWFALFSTLVGGIYGDYHGLGEIQTLGMFRSRFESFVGAFNKRLIPCDAKKRTGFRSAFFSKPKVSNDEKQIEKIDARLFTQTWNKIITCFREEDLINNSEKLLLLVPPCEDHEPDIIQWPLFLLASKIPTALDTMVDSDGEDYHDLKKKMGTDLYLSSAIRECYDSFRNIISALVFGQPEKKIIQEIFKIVEKHMEEGTLIKKMNLRNLPTLSKKFIELLQLLLKNSEEDIDQVVILFQDIIKVVTRDIMMELDQLSSTRDSIINAWYTMVAQHDQLFTKAIEFPVKESNGWTEKINRLHLLLTLKESDVDDVPRNLDARQRILFFANSLFMEIPNAPKVQAMLPFSVLTPYYNDDILLSSERLKVENEDGISIIFYLQKMYPDEWKNFLERVHSSFEDELWGKGPQEEDLRLWASYRMQTLSRTVRGMMYYRKALEFQAFLDIAKDEDLSEDNGATKLIPEESKLITQCQAIADMKFTYVVTCHIYGKQKRIGDPRAQDILTLLRM